ncbi:MAG: cytochrome c3 family protein [Steroidobacteraceae bacterium]
MSYVSVVPAAGIETLLMPGKVSNAHAKLESTCGNCHDRTNRVSQTSLCVDCHKDIAADMQKHSGFHGRLANIDKLQCQGCHTEHKGRDADIVKFVPEQFDHQRTDFPLRDAHVGAACASCHQAGKKYREAQSSCVACHKKDEPHQGQLGTDCAACHGGMTWLNARFDHGKTRFALSNKHADVQCVACHAGNRYKNTPMQCVSCHAPDDVHQSSRGNNCEQCHSTLSWTAAKFDHARETGFALNGAHARTDCVSCHTSGRMEDPVPKDCNGCHKAQDSHAGRMGQKCDTCHDSTNWKPPTFEHARDAKFALTGPHGRLSCDTCHTANVATQKLGTTCIGCHRAQDAHSGQLGEHCEQCHVADTWRGDVRFDHDLTDFPLVGLHVPVPCAQCHLTQQFKDARTDCYDCHQKADVHQGGLGKHCDSCHSPNGWNLWEFDHNKQTHFPLTGAHAPLGCADCHRDRVDTFKPSTDCISCHQQDDIHAGQFGRQCQRCHTTATFRGGRAR